MGGVIYQQGAEIVENSVKQHGPPMAVATTTVLSLQFTLPLIALLHFNTRVSIICDGGFCTALEEYFPVVQVLYVQSGGR
jgi:hypothetical protein